MYIFYAFTDFVCLSIVHYVICNALIPGGNKGNNNNSELAQTRVSALRV